jgi:hypothetical protein
MLTPSVSPVSVRCTAEFLLMYPITPDRVKPAIPAYLLCLNLVELACLGYYSNPVVAEKHTSDPLQDHLLDEFHPFPKYIHT